MPRPSLSCLRAMHTGVIGGCECTNAAHAVGRGGVAAHLGRRSDSRCVGGDARLPRPQHAQLECAHQVGPRHGALRQRRHLGRQRRKRAGEGCGLATTQPLLLGRQRGQARELHRRGDIVYSCLEDVARGAKLELSRYNLGKRACEHIGAVFQIDATLRECVRKRADSSNEYACAAEPDASDTPTTGTPCDIAVQNMRRELREVAQVVRVEKDAPPCPLLQLGLQPASLQGWVRARLGLGLGEA
eukprot:scaffold72489_cov75-Phaeocystis_antarctica.AAC.3